MAVFRSFIALDISAEVRHALSQMQDGLRDAGARVSWVGPDRIHLTLAFLGDVLEEAVPGLAHRLDAAALPVSCFKFQVIGLGFFGRPRAPRVVWAGVPGPPAELRQLHGAAADAVRSLGFTTEDRPFAPHITIGRIHTAARARELTSSVDGHKDTPFGEVGVRCLLLMRSHLDEPRARYSILHESPLKGT